jgi:hypothetical protein
MREVRLPETSNRPISVVRVRHATDNALQENVQSKREEPDGSADTRRKPKSRSSMRMNNSLARKAQLNR